MRRRLRTRTASWRWRGSVDVSPCSSMLCCVSRRGIAGADLGSPYDHCSSKERPVDLERVVESGQFHEPGEIFVRGKLGKYFPLSCNHFFSSHFFFWLTNTVYLIFSCLFNISFLVEKVRYFYQQDFQEHPLRASQ